MKKILSLILILILLPISFTISSDLPLLPSDLPLIHLEDFDYQGAFRLKTGTYGDAKTGFSEAKIAYNHDNRTFFVQSRKDSNSIAEFPITTFSTSSDIADLQITSPPVQDFSKIYDRTVTGNTQGLDEITGMHYFNGQLYVNAVEWYDAAGDNTHTSLVVKNASDLANSQINGFYELGGKARGAGWITRIPSEWQPIFGGDYISGYASSDSIVSRFSVGPSASYHSTAFT